jgi:hypothetical protein
MQWSSAWEAVNIAVKTRGLAPQGSPATIVVGSSFVGSPNYAIVGQKEVNDLEWHHVAVTVEDVSVYADDPLLNTSWLVVSLFVDGVLEGRTPSSIWDGFNTSFNFPGVSGDYWWTSIGSNTTVTPHVAHLAIHNKAIPQERLMSRYAYTQSPRPIINGGYRVWTGSKWENFLV